MTDSADPIPEAADEAVEPAVEEAVAPPRRPRHGKIERPARLARAAHRAALDPEVKAPSAAKFHARRSLVPTGTRVRPAPKVRAFSDAGRVEVELGERVPAGEEPRFKRGELGSVEGQA